MTRTIIGGSLFVRIVLLAIALAIPGVLISALDGNGHQIDNLASTDTGPYAIPWFLLNNPTPSDAMILGSTCTDAWNCWRDGAVVVSGNNQEFDGVMEHFDGSAWTAVPTEAPPSGSWLLTSVTCVTADDCWAAGAIPTGPTPTPLVEQWNGSTWSIVPTGPASGYLLGVGCAGADSCFAVGSNVDSSGNASTALMEQWNGSTWTVVNLPDTGQTYSALNNVTCATASGCWTVGWSGPNQATGNFLPIYPSEIGGNALIEQWNGSSWAIVASPQPVGGSYLGGVTCVGAADCWAVGSVTNATGLADTALVEQWTGTAWNEMATPQLDSQPGVLLESVTCVSASYCQAVGSSGEENGITQGAAPASAFWNGSTWSTVQVGGTFTVGLLNSVACAGDAQCFASGLQLVPQSQNTNFGGILEAMPVQQGYLMTGSDGGVFSFGEALFSGSESGRRLAAPVIGVAAVPDDTGYWLVGADGGVFSFGGARYFGSEGGRHLAAPVAGMAPTADGNGYWMVASDGGVFNFGDAGFRGSEGGHHLAAPVVGITGTSDDGGYWLVGSDGGVFSFGDASYLGSESGKSLNAPIVGIASTPDGKGYWLVGSDGGVFTFGDAGFFGSEGSQHLTSPIVGIVATPDGNGYWLISSDGSVHSFGSAQNLGSMAGLDLAAPIVGGA
ncbi:MAG: hypothetical protein WAM97_07690 [Acidimicrobiales bacterium]